MKTAIITGVNGQVGSYLAELLLEKGYRVIGVIRRSSVNTLERIAHISNINFSLVEGDVTDAGCMAEIVSQYQPDEFYNTAAQSHVATSFKQPKLTFEVNTIGVLNILEAIRFYSPKTKFINCGTSEQFGKNYSESKEGKKYQNEKTPFYAQSPYGVSKIAAFHLIANYRESYNLFACSSISFNHEGCRRGEQFVTRKITKYLGKLVKAKSNIHNMENYWKEGNIYDEHGWANYLISKVGKLKLGNLDAFRDWSDAQDIVVGLHLILQQEMPQDLVLSSGETHSVREFLELAFKYAGFKEDEIYRFVEIDPELVRPAEVDYLLGDSSKARSVLGWEPKISFYELVCQMVQHDIEVQSGKKKKEESEKVC